MTLSPPRPDAAKIAPAAAPLPPELLARIAAGAAQRDAQRELPFELIAEIKALGFGALRLPRAEGGAGAALTDVMAAAITLAQADPNVAHIWRNHHVQVERLLTFPTERPHLLALRQRVAAGDLLALANTELGHPQIGGHVPLSTRLERQGGGFVLRGRKFYSTGSLFADWIYIPASLEDGSRAYVVLPRTRQGIETIDDWDGMGQRLTGSGTTVLQDVPVEPGEILWPGDVPAARIVLGSIVAQLFLTGVIAGVVAAIAHDAAQLLAGRSRNFYYAPHPQAAQDPLLLAALGEREADAFAARATVLAAADVLDRGITALSAQQPDAHALLEAGAAAAAKAKIVVDRLAHHAATALFDIAGASATRASLNLDRHWRNIRTISSHNPASHKAYALGNLTVNDARLPTQGFF